MRSYLPFRTAPIAVALAIALLLATAPAIATAQDDAGAAATEDDAAEPARRTIPEERDPALYRAEVELISQGSAERRAAASRALGSRGRKHVQLCSAPNSDALLQSLPA